VLTVIAGVGVLVAVAVLVGVRVAVFVAVGVLVGVLVGASVAVNVGVLVGVSVGLGAAWPGCAGTPALGARRNDAPTVTTAAIIEINPRPTILRMYLLPSGFARVLC
jgi:hypothetical protein